MKHLNQISLKLIVEGFLLFGPYTASYGGAIRNSPGFTTTTFLPNDDGTFPTNSLNAGTPPGTPIAQPLGFTANFYGLSFTTAFINNNGNITFDAPLSTFTPFNLTSTTRKIIAPFFADVDTRFVGSPVRFGYDTVNGRNAFGVNWLSVDYFASSINHTNRNSFQLVLINRSDVGPGDFDMEFNYDHVQWEAGTASGGDANGLGGNSARAGFSNGSGADGTFFELSGSASPGSFLDSNPTAGLIHGMLGDTQAGRYVFQVRNGIVQATPTPTPTPGTPTPTTTPTPTPTLPPPVATISLPVATVSTSITTFTQPVVTSTINAVDNLIGFQGDFTFDSTVVSFQSPPVSAAGLTANNWNVAGNVLPGVGPIRTLRVAAFSNDGMTPLSGSGTLFTLNMSRVSSIPGASTALIWAAPPDDFEFINTDLDLRAPMSATPGSITIQATPIQLSGTVSYCTNAVPDPVPNVTLILTGTSSDSTLSNNSGTYQLSSLTPGGSYVVTPTKTALTPTSSGIDTVDAIAVQMHYLNIATLPQGCALAAADVNGDTLVNTYDVIAIQRFFIGRTFGIGNVGNYKFTPTSRAYTGINANQTNQDYDALILGDVAAGFVHRADGQSQAEASTGDAAQVPTSVETLTLPEISIDQSKTDWIAPVTTSTIDMKERLVGFQGDFTFDERAITFPSEPVQKAGLTGGNWNVSGNVLDGKGPIRTLRISAFSNDFTPLSGSGTLFELRIIRVGMTSQSTQLVWAAPPDNFVFIDANLKVQRPGSISPGSVGLSGKRK